MLTSGKMALKVFLSVFILFGLLSPAGYSADGKMGYVDLRKAFYEYDKTKSLEKELNDLTEDRQGTRTAKIETITKLRDEAELLNGDARNRKQGEIDAKLVELQEFDRETRQELLNKKNDMFREVIDDIQKVVEGIGKQGNYDYVLDSRNIMYAKEDYDLTSDVLKQLNKQ